MKTPQTTAGGDQTPTTIPPLSTGTTIPDIRKIPAHVGVISSIEVGAGTPAQAGQPGDITPSTSGLIGSGDDGLPAAAKKPDAAFGPSRDGTPKADPVAPVKPTFDKTAAPKAQPAPVRKTGFWPVAFGGVVAAGLGAAATIYALPHLPAGWLPAAAPPAAQDAPDPQVPDPQPMIDAASDAGRQAAEQVLAAAPQPAPQDDLLPRIEALEQQVAALDQAPAPEQTPDQTPEPAPQPASVAPDQLADLRQRLDDQQARLDDLAARPAFDPDAATALQQQIETAAAEAQSSLDATRAQAQELQDAAADSTRRAEAVAAIAALQTALDAGVTPDQARAALEGAGLETPQALQTEIASLTDLQSTFPEAARAALRASLRDTSASGQGNLFTNFFLAQTGARSVEPRDGDDPDAILSRADADVQAGRIDAALTQMQALPASATAAPAMADWLSRATAYTQARAALSDLSPATN